jgi:hypothetical protein
MRPFPLITVRADDADVVQRWAALEGKSPAMSDDLYRRYASLKPTPRRLLIPLALVAKHIMATAELMRLLRT